MLNYSDPHASRDTQNPVKERMRRKIPMPQADSCDPRRSVGCRRGAPPSSEGPTQTSPPHSFTQITCVQPLF